MCAERRKNPLKECVEFIENHKLVYSKEDEPYSSDPEEETFEIQEDKIFEIPKCRDIDIKNIGFVDGGNGPILRSSDFNVSLNRVAGVLFTSNTWTKPIKTPVRIEFYSATVLDVLDDDTLAYITQFFPVEPEFSKYLPNEELNFSINDPSIREGVYRLPNIDIFGGIAMRFAEWTYANKFISDELDEGSIFVRDGSLQSGYTGENEIAENLYKSAINKGVIVTGLSKTCRLITQTGNSLNSLVHYMGNKKFPDSAWYYHPVYRITKAQEQADLYFVKLHKNSYYSFRFDILLNQAEKMSEDLREIIISNLSNNSNDLSYPGYPYGLIKADQLAAVSLNELEPQKIQLIAEFNQEDYNKFILPRLRSVNAHDLLNIIRR
ncbi:MAG: DNA double-strand break repair nuclease NurA [Candidatus Thorarchaeota archaeon]